ncbi:protein FAM196A [Labeo rohita]|uniref:Protein FAM196A n=1 Tax=Labeo rohita TaxID=84645 RepID=A0A498M7D2_LABRO|nr:protein FAM196A [Labeo rohita]
MKGACLALPSRSLTQMIIGARRPSANEAEMRAGRRKASTRALHLCVRLRVPLHSNECRVELDFKLQEDKLQPLMKRLCPADESPFPPLPYPQETIGSTPKRKSKAEAKKHARWKLWFL